MEPTQPKKAKGPMGEGNPYPDAVEVLEGGALVEVPV